MYVASNGTIWVGEECDRDSALLPSLKVETRIRRKNRNHPDMSPPASTFPSYLHVIARQWGPNLGRLRVEGETPPPLDISRSRERKELELKNNNKKRYSERVNVPKMNQEVKRSGAVLLSNLSYVCISQSLGLQMAQPPPTKTHSKKWMERERERRGRGGEGGLLGACRVRLNPFTAGGESSLEQVI